MQYTLVFRAKDNYQITYELFFEPNPVWRKGEDWYLSLNPEYPVYEAGSIKKLFEREVYILDSLHEQRECIIVLEGNSLDDKNTKELIKDLESEGFKVTISGFGTRK